MTKIIDLAQTSPINGVQLESGHMAVDVFGDIFVTTEKFESGDRFKHHFARPAKPEEAEEWRKGQPTLPDFDPEAAWRDWHGVEW